MNILIIGAGAYGLALATVLSEKNNVTVYSVNKEEINNLNNTYKNELLFPNIDIPKQIRFTDNLDMALIDIELIIIVIPTNYIDEIAYKLKNKISKKTKICIASKGINKKNNKFAYNIIKEIINIKEIYVLSGPSFAIDTIKKENIILTLAGKNANKLKTIFPEKYIKIETTKDIIGTEVSGTLKNIFALASGMLEGMSVSESTKAAFLTKIINETNKIIIELKGNKTTILKSCGIGDILLTCTSKNSRNYNLGYMIGKNENKEKIKEYINNTTIEGLEALISIKQIFKEKNINSEIINIIYDIIYNEKDCKYIVEYIVK